MIVFKEKILRFYPYKGVEFRKVLNNIIHKIYFKYDNKIFSNVRDVKSYIDKTILRQMKLERLKGI